MKTVRIGTQIQTERNRPPKIQRVQNGPPNKYREKYYLYQRVWII